MTRGSLSTFKIWPPKRVFLLVTAGQWENLFSENDTNHDSWIAKMESPVSKAMHSSLKP